MKTDRDWEAWGASDPYYGVLTDDRFMSGNIDRFRDDFFQSGEAFITGVLEQVERLFGPIAPGRAMDFGCGVGRLALPLARRFRSATGVDISASMLAEAARNAARAGLGNLDWVLSDEGLTRVEGPFDFINSYIVLQHIPARAGMRLIARLLDLVAPGGAVMLHVSVRRRATPARRIAYWVRHHVPGGAALGNLATGRPVAEPPMQMNEYPLMDLVELFARSGFGPVACVPEMHNGVSTVMMMARRGAAQPDARP